MSVDVWRRLTDQAQHGCGIATRMLFDARARRGREASVLAVHYAMLALALDFEAAGSTLPGSITESMQTASIGLDWIQDQRAIVRHALIDAIDSNEVDLGNGLGVALTAACEHMQSVACGGSLRRKLNPWAWHQCS